MKEFIEKLIGRLEETDLNDIQMVVREVLLKYGFPYECVVQDEVWGALDELSTNKFAIGIVNQLAEEYKPTTNSNIQEVIDNLEVYTVGRLKNARVHITVEELQNQIDRLEQLAEEHNNDFCEWKKIFDDDVDSQYKTSCSEDGIVDMTGYFDYEFCPYCGKRIKVVE